MKKRVTRSGGFTLIELLVVIAIIAILASLLVPALAAGKVAVRKSLCLNNQRQMALATQMYGDDSNGAFPKADPIDHTLWIKTMFSTRNFSTLKIFEDPAEREGGNDYTKLRTFPITIDGERRNFIGSYGINERLAGPNGIEMPTYQSVRVPSSIFFFGCATYFIVPDWDHERVYNAGGPQPIGATINPPRKKWARHGSGTGSKPGSVITYVDGHAQFQDQKFIDKKLLWRQTTTP
jgi:prepilin-type N-terminal cleavage/methylation domain-containing protein